MGRFKDFKRQDFAGGSGSLGMVEEDGGVVEVLWPAPFHLCLQTAVPLTSWPSTPVTAHPPFTFPPSWNAAPSAVIQEESFSSLNCLLSGLLS